MAGMIDRALGAWAGVLVLTVLAGVLATPTARAEELGSPIELPAAADGTGGPDALIARVSGPGEFSIWTMDNAGEPLDLAGRWYALVGTLDARGVQGSAYLELISTIDGKPYFSRTLGTGRMASISGDLTAHSFALPFDTLDESKRPTRLELRAVMPAGGTIAVNSARLGTITKAQWSAMSSGWTGPGAPWWSDRTAGFIGAVGGSAIGLLGGLIGVLAGRGRARSVVVALLWTMVGVGTLALGVGLLAMVMRQPYAVWYPPLLVGVLLATLIPAMWPTILRRYREREMGRIAALDAA